MGFMKSMAQGGMFGAAGLAASAGNKTKPVVQKQRAFGSMATTLNQQAGRPSLITRGG